MRLFIFAFLMVTLLAGSTRGSLVEELRQGNEAAVRSAVEGGLDVNSADEYGNTLLMQAAVYSSHSLVKFLLTHDASPKAANRAGHTALMRAMPDLAKMKLLVEHGADVNAATAQGDTALIMTATVPSGANALRYLIGKGAALDAVNKEGANAVMMAAFEGQFDNLNQSSCRQVWRLVVSSCWMWAKSGSGRRGGGSGCSVPNSLSCNCWSSNGSGRGQSRPDCWKRLRYSFTVLWLSWYCGQSAAEAA